MLCVIVSSSLIIQTAALWWFQGGDEHCSRSRCVGSGEQSVAGKSLSDAVANLSPGYIAIQKNARISIRSTAFSCVWIVGWSSGCRPSSGRKDEKSADGQMVIRLGFVRAHINQKRIDIDKMGETLTLRGTLAGHKGWVTAIAPPLDPTSDVLLSSSR